MPRESILEYLANFERHGRKWAYVRRTGYRPVRWSYRQVLEAARRFARELESQQIGKGDRILIWGENTPEWVAAFFGSVLRGAIVVPMDRIAAPDFALRVFREVDAKLMVCSADLAQHHPELPQMTIEALERTLAVHSAEPYPLPDVGRNDTVQIVFTSGTTADPKGVVITHGNILANLEPLEREIQSYLKHEWLVHPIRLLNLLPLSHVFGQFLGIFIPQLFGGTVIFQDSLNPSEVMRTVKRERVSVLVTVPRFMQSLKDKVERDFDLAGRRDWLAENLRAAEHEHYLWRWWRFRRVRRQFGWKFWAFVVGGAALDEATEEFWRRLGYGVIQGYGLTETTSLISVNHPFRVGRGSIGKVLPGRDIKIDETGEILVRGENVASGYWQGRQLTPVQSPDGDKSGWFRTGDLGELDAEGNLYFKGRKKNVIVTPEGMNVYPEDLETALRQQPEVRDCVVVGVAREKNAEPCAVLILRDSTSPEEIVRRANRKLAEYQHMRCWYVWPEEDFPRTSTQKPKVSVIQQAVQQQRAPGSEAAPATGPLAELLARITGRTPTALDPGARLDEDLNLSSIDRVELLGALEDRYQVDLSESRFTAATTVSDLERMLREPAPARPHHHYPRWAQRWPVTWIRRLVYYLVAWPATHILGHPRVKGREKLRDVRGPVLVVSNHITYIDIGFVLAAMPARIRNRLAAAMQGEMLLEMGHPPKSRGVIMGFLDWLAYWLMLALFNIFPLPQRSGFRESFAYAGESVDRGYSVLVFPEGARTETGEMARFRAGIGILANHLKIPVVPMRIHGLWELKASGRRGFAGPGKITVNIGESVQYPPGSDPEWIARDLEARVKAL